jgi:hypothetical protein
VFPSSLIPYPGGRTDAIAFCIVVIDGDVRLAIVTVSAEPPLGVNVSVLFVVVIVTDVYGFVP